MIKEVNELTIINEDIVTKYNIASQKYNDRLMEKQKKTEIFKNNQIEINHKKQLSDIERSTAQLQVRRFIVYNIIHLYILLLIYYKRDSTISTS